MQISRMRSVRLPLNLQQAELTRIVVVRITTYYYIIKKTKINYKCQRLVLLSMYSTNNFFLSLMMIEYKKE